MDRLLRIGALASLLTLVTACAGVGPAAQPPAVPGKNGLRIAMILPGPVQDADFNALGVQALEQIRQQTGAQTSFSESIPVANAERVGREYLNSGYKVVLFHGAQYLTIVQRLAPSYPDSKFVIISSALASDLPANVWSIDRNLHRGFYALGVLGAASTQRRRVGFVSGVRLPEFIASLNAIKQAIEEEAPDVQVLYSFVGDQNDPIRAREATTAQINAGADFIIATVNLGMSGVAEAARAAPRPVVFTTFYTEKRELAPDRLATSLLVDFATPYLEAIRQVQQGMPGAQVIEMQPGRGLELAEVRNVPPDAATRARQAFDAVATGTKEVVEVFDRIVGD